MQIAVTSPKLAKPIQPFFCGIVSCFCDIISHVEPTMITLGENQTDLSLSLNHLCKSQAGMLLL